jgi:hypothetical protein
MKESNPSFIGIPQTLQSIVWFLLSELFPAVVADFVLVL